MLYKLVEIGYTDNERASLYYKLAILKIDSYVLQVRGGLTMLRKNKIQEAILLLGMALFVGWMIEDWLILAILLVPAIFLLFDEDSEEER